MMDYLVEGLLKALEFIFCLDNEIYGIVERSVRFALTATLFASLLGVPIGFLIASKSFRGKPAVITLLNTLMALPTVVVGLLGYAFFSRMAPLGFLELIFTPSAVILGEFFLSLPVITNLTVSAVQAVDARVYVTAQSLGAGRWMVAWTVLMEARFSPSWQPSSPGSAGPSPRLVQP